MLHEVAASDLDLTTIVNPTRKMLQRVRFFAGEIDRINIEQRNAVISHGFDHHQHTLECDLLVLGLGGVTNLYGISGLQQYALTMESFGCFSGRTAGVSARFSVWFLQSPSRYRSGCCAGSSAHG